MILASPTKNTITVLNYQNMYSKDENSKSTIIKWDIMKKGSVYKLCLDKNLCILEYNFGEQNT